MPTYFIVSLADKTNVSYVADLPDITTANYNQVAHELKIVTVRIAKERNLPACDVTKVEIVNISRL